MNLNPTVAVDGCGRVFLPSVFERESQMALLFEARPPTRPSHVPQPFTSKLPVHRRSPSYHLTCELKRSWHTPHEMYLRFGEEGTPNV